MDWVQQLDLISLEQGNHKIKKITQDGIVSTLAGSGSQGNTDAQGLLASFNNPYGLVVDENYNVYVADYSNNAIRKITADGIVSTIATISRPIDIVIDSESQLFITSNSRHQIYKFNPENGSLSEFTGISEPGFKDGRSSTAQFNGPQYLAIDALNNLYVSDTNNNKIRKITSSGLVSSIAGTGIKASEDGLSNEASFSEPTGICLDPNTGDIYISEYNSSRIRKITKTPPPTKVEVPVYIPPVNRAPFIELMTDIELDIDRKFTINEGKSIDLKVFAFDPEEGFSIAPNITWRSDIQGLLAYGISINTSILKSGLHQIRVLARDSQGLENSVFFRVEVLETNLEEDETDNGTILNPNEVGTTLLKVFTPKRKNFKKGKRLIVKALAVNFLDPESEDLIDLSRQIVWLSDLDGQIGTGKRLKINTRKLQAGLHTITAQINGVEKNFEINIKNKK